MGHFVKLTEIGMPLVTCISGYVSICMNSVCFVKTLFLKLLNENGT